MVAAADLRGASIPELEEKVRQLQETIEKLQAQQIQNTPKQILKPKLLIGEGIEEVLFLNALIAHLGITTVQVETYGGKSALTSYLKTLFVRPGSENLVSLGITRDADTNAVAAFQSICGTLSNLGKVPPSKAGDFSGTDFRVGVFILPDGENSGMLEDICLAAIKDNPEIPCIDSYFDCVRDKVQRQPNPSELSKARVHAWLASHPEPDKRLGEAAAMGLWPWESSAFEQIVKFIQLL